MSWLRLSGACDLHGGGGDDDGDAHLSQPTCCWRIALDGGASGVDRGDRDADDDPDDAYAFAAALHPSSVY